MILLPRPSKSAVIFIASLLSLVVIIWVFNVWVGTLDGRNPLAIFIRVLADALVLMLPFWFLPQRLRWTVFIPLFLMPMWCIGSIWYFRFWKDIPALNSLLLVGNLNHELLNSVKALWDLKDLLLFLPSLFTLVLYIIIPADRKRSFRKEKRSLKVAWSMCIATVLCFILAQHLYTRSYMKYYNGNGIAISYGKATTDRLITPILSVQLDVRCNGWLIYTVKSAIQAVKLLNLHQELSDAEIEDISSFIDSSPAFSIPDSVSLANKDKNVILILVESLNSFAVKQIVNGKPVCPTMLSLLNREGTVSALDIITQIRTGGSGDGQLIVNTGLLPLPDFSTSIVTGNTNRFIALPECLDRKESVAVFGDDASSWNEYGTFSNYGFNSIYRNSDYPKLVKQLGGDGAMMRFSSGIIKNLKSPFFMEMLTVSMHVPFNDTDVPATMIDKGISNDPSIPEVTRDYLLMVNYFDTCLGKFVSELKEVGIYDETILIITSDHCQTLAFPDNVDNADIPIPFIATNTGISMQITRKAGQVDIFPTILELCGAPNESWKGLGTSLLNPEVSSAYLPTQGNIGKSSPSQSQRQQRAYDISEKIIRGNYFAQ